MFKGFSDSSRNQEFHGFPNLNFQMNNEAYGFSGCTFWLDAAYGLNTQTNLEAVSIWTDRILGSQFRQQTAGNQPRLILSNPSYNNYPTVEFQAAARYLVSQNATSMPIGTLAFVARNNTAAAANHSVTLLSQADGNNQGNGKICLKRSTSGSIYNQGIGPYSGATAIMDSGVVDAAVHIVIIQSGVGNAAIMVDGVDYITSSTWSPGQSYTQIGGNGITATGLNGDVAEILIYSSNTINRFQLSTRLNSKYAIY